MSGSDPDAPAGAHPGGEDAEPTPVIRPRIARRRPSSGPVLPTVTEDERDIGWGGSPEPDDDERLLREVPPHHGG